MFARIQDGKIVELWGVDTLPPLHPDIAALYVECSPSEEVGDLYDGAAFSKPTPPIKTPEQIAADIEMAVQKHMDSVAATKGYDNRITCALRAGYVGPYQQDGIIFGAWMDTCWQICYAIQADVVANIRPIPTADEVIAELPLIVWGA